jgi:hypothetical protein
MATVLSAARAVDRTTIDQGFKSGGTTALARVEAKRISEALTVKQLVGFASLEAACAAGNLQSDFWGHSGCRWQNSPLFWLSSNRESTFDLFKSAAHNTLLLHSTEC